MMKISTIRLSVQQRRIPLPAFLQFSVALFLLCVSNQINSSSSFTFDPSGNMVTNTKKVLVTGASGQTGRLVLKKLEEDSRYEPKALVRTEGSARRLVQSEINVPLEHMIISDIASPNFEKDLPSGLEGLEAMIVCTSAVPRISQRSLLKAMMLAPLNLVRRKKPIDFKSLQFKWKHNGYPEIVDYYGQIKQFNLAKKLGVKHVVLVSSMGVTDRSHFLNNVGKKSDGSGDGDILVWKRKAERYLVESGLDYTILHPGGLVDGPGGVQQLELDVDDNMFAKYPRTCICREDLADLCVSSLEFGKAKKLSFDCIARNVEEGQTRRDANMVLQNFLEEAKTANYR
ncbi:unnamed protein product [Cylindrotheca closterium]|uniref:NAD(P)-binding domain-containing protein n=1 Tax=Cylindrotheca closterium TaxID=2856 RepID=A0AAD2CL37_9STRA|nr:unnamed protein product [Cylindrotheca closterium]